MQFRSVSRGHFLYYYFFLFNFISTVLRKLKIEEEKAELYAFAVSDSLLPETSVCTGCGTGCLPTDYRSLRDTVLGMITVPGWLSPL